MEPIRTTNPLVALEAVFQDGVRLRLSIHPPVPQAQFMLAIGSLLGSWGVEFDVELQAQEERHG